jgi:SAM-dependent methyltransferase
VLRAIGKGAVLAAFGYAPGGPAMYRSLTRGHLGTAATHVDKLARVLPEYARLWQRLGALELDGARIWTHDGGATAFSPLASFLLTGRAGVMTNRRQPVLGRYMARSVNACLAADFEPAPELAARRAALEPQRWSNDAVGAIRALGGDVHVGVAAGEIPMAAESADVCHSGGALEHYRPGELDAFLRDSYRVLMPGGIASHVFDHRDHLYHADKRIPFCAHLALPDALYEPLLGRELAYHNRLPPTEVERHFEAAGFERIAIRRMTLPRQTYVSDDDLLDGVPGLSRRLLARRFRDISEADLRTAAAHYLYRKPLG